MPAFNPGSFISTWAGILLQGAMDGEFFSAEHREDLVDLHVGSQGFASFIINPNESGMIKYTLSQKSPTNALLSAAQKLRTVGPWLSKELDDVTTVIEGAEAMIMKPAAIKRSNKIVGYEWSFLVKKLVLTHGGDA